MTDEDPCPLKAGGEASPELVHALYAIRRHDPDPARLARVAQKLGAALAGGPPPGAAASGGAGKWLGAKTWITSLLLGVSAFLFLGVPRAEESAAPASSPPVPVPAPEPAPAPPPHTIDAPKPAAAPPARPAPRRAKPRSEATAVERRERAATSLAPTTAIEPHAAASLSPTATEVLEAPEPPPAAPKKTTAAPRSEVELLFEARVAMPRQPAAALRLLDEHAARFPGGQLGPEREVLAIEALRKLGRTAEAKRRWTEFQTRYPKSIHQRRLQASNSQPKI